MRFLAGIKNQRTQITSNPSSCPLGWVSWQVSHSSSAQRFPRNAADNCSDSNVETAVALVNNGLAVFGDGLRSEAGFNETEQGRSICNVCTISQGAITCLGLASCVQVEWVSETANRIDEFLFCSWEEAKCNATMTEQRNSDSKSDYKNPDKFGQAFDFKSTTNRKLDVDFWVRDWDLILDEDGGPPRVHRIPAVVNMISDAWMKYSLNDEDYRSYLLGVQEVPKVETKLTLPFSSFIAVLLTTWVVQLLLPLMLVQLVYEKEQNLRIMMKMHGLGETAYWTVNYLYYLTLYVLYILVFVAFAAAADFAIFTKNNYGTSSP